MCRNLRAHLCRRAFRVFVLVPGDGVAVVDRKVDEEQQRLVGAERRLELRRDKRRQRQERAGVQAAARKILVRRVECARHARRPRALLVHQLSVDAVDAGGDRASHGGDRHGRATLGAAQEIVQRRAASGPVPDVRQRHRWPGAAGQLAWRRTQPVPSHSCGSSDYTGRAQRPSDGHEGAGVQRSSPDRDGSAHEVYEANLAGASVCAQFGGWRCRHSARANAGMSLHASRPRGCPAAKASMGTQGSVTWPHPACDSGTIACVECACHAAGPRGTAAAAPPMWRALCPEPPTPALPRRPDASERTRRPRQRA